MPVDLIAKIQQKNDGTFKLLDVEDLDAGDLDVVMQLIAGGGVIAGVDASAPVGEIAVQRKTTAGAPTHVATEATLCWSEVDAILYASQGAGVWVPVGAEGGLAGHLADTEDAHDASAVSVVPFGTTAATDVQAALEEIAAEAGAGGHPDLAAHDVLGLATDAELAGHTGNTSDAHDASAVSLLDTANQYAASDVEAALAEVLDAEQAHEADSSAAHAASAMSLLDVAAQYAATDVEAALAEVLDTEQAHEADAAGAHGAGAIANTPAGIVASTDVQAAIDEVALFAYVPTYGRYYPERYVGSDGVALAAAAAAAGITGTLVLGSGKSYELVTGDEQTWKCNVEGSGAILHWSGTRPTGAVITLIGDAAETGPLDPSTSVYQNRTARLPDVTYGTTLAADHGTNVAAADIGLKIVNAQNSYIHQRRVSHFNTGWLVTNVSDGGSYFNEFHLPVMTGCPMSLKILSTGAGSINDSKWYGGHLPSYPGVSGARCILIADSDPHRVNNHSFFATSLESNIAASEYRLECWGYGNYWYDCRWEGTSIPHVYFAGAPATGRGVVNRIVGGYQSFLIVVTEDAPGGYNYIDSPTNTWGFYKSGAGVTNFGDDDLLFQGITPMDGATGVAHDTTTGRAYLCARAAGVWLNVQVGVDVQDDFVTAAKWGGGVTGA